MGAALPVGEPQEAADVLPASSRRITRRAVLIGAALIPFNVFWVLRLERVMFGPYPSTISLFPNAVFVLFLLVGANALLRRHAARVAFSQAELITIYLMVAVSTGLAGLDGVAILNQIIPHGAWFGKLAGKWGDFLDAYPAWLTIKDPEIVRGHFLGSSSFYTWPVLRAWAVPILAWSGFIIVLLWTAMCMNVLVRRQWQDRERLTFPIVWLPLEMSDPGGGLFRSPLMWAGFALAAALGLFNGLAFLYPSVPMLPIGLYDLKPLFTTKPWSAIDWFPTTLYPLAIGLGYLLPLDLLFSCWFFFLFWKAQMVVSNIYAWDVTPDFPFIREQGFGAVIGLAGFYLWTGRRSLAEAWREAWRRGRGDAETRGNEEMRKWGNEDPTPNAQRPTPNLEALSYRAAFLGLAIGFLLLTVFCLAAGMSLWLAVAFFVLYLAIIFVIVRIRAELGPPVHDFHFIGPDRMLPRALGVTGWRQNDLAMLSMFWSLNRAHRGDVAPVGLESLYAAHRRGWEPGTMFWAVMLAVVLGTLSTFIGHEHQAYQLGTGAKFNQGYWQGAEAYGKMEGWVGGSQDAKPNVPAVWAMVVGLFSCLSLLWLRLRFVGFPLHPIGYAISSGWSIHLVWLPLFIAWLAKILAMRYGGLASYRRFLPFFLGLILGDCVQGSMWGLVSLLFNMRTYNFFGA
jgi:hypothetical protein